MPMKKRRVSTPTNEELSKYSETELLYKSNLFRLQTAELVREVVPKQSTELEAAVRALRTEMMALSPVELTWESSAASVDALPVVSHPELLHVRLVNSKMSLSWHAPEHVELVGSYLLRTVARPSLNIDVAVRIPQASLLHKDYLDHRYADKRMLYLGYLGGQLLKACAGGKKGDARRRVSFVWLPHLQDRRWPVLQLVLPALAGGWTIRLVPSLASGAFTPAKLVPDRSNLRDRTVVAAGAASSPDDGTGFDRAPSPEYNNRLALESAYGSALRLLHVAYSADADGALREATIMLKVWLRQRTAHQAGGVCGFQLSLLLVHLLSERVLSHSMGAYHIFRVVLNHLSKNSLEASAIVLPAAGAKTDVAEDGRGLQAGTEPSLRASAASRFGRHFAWVLTDSTLSANFGAGVTRGALRELRAAASRSIAAIDSPALDDAVSFAELFMRAQPPFLRYDALFSWELPVTDGPAGAHLVVQAERAARAAAAAAQAAADSPMDSEAGGGVPPASVEDKRPTPVSENVASATAAAAEAVLTAGLTRRAHLVRCWHEPLPEQPLNLLDPPASGALGGVSRTHAGLLLEPALAARPVDRGPVPGSPAAAAWVGLWGDKSETRRFRDGAVVHAVVWDADDFSRHLIPAQAVRYLLSHHLQVEPVATSLGAVESALRRSGRAGGAGVSGTWKSASGEYIAAYEKIASAIRKLDGLPLAVASIQPVGAVFSHCEEFPFTALEAEAALSAASAEDGGEPIDRSAVARFVVQFESSSKWPDELSAIAALKTAFYLKLADLLEAQAPPIRCEPRRAGLVVLVNGLPLLGTISHAKEEKLLSDSGDEAGASRLALATSAGVAHTAAMHVIASRSAAFGPTVRLAKRWLHCQLCSDAFRPQLVELMVAFLFSPAATRAPGSATLGLARFLALLATHDFANEPLVVQLDEEINSDSRAAARRAFAAAREAAGPSGGSTIWVATSTQLEGSAWCQAGPAVEIVRRVQRLAASALRCLERAMSHAAPLPRRSERAHDVPTPAVGGKLAMEAEIAEIAMRAFHPPLNEFDVLLHLDESRLSRAELRLRPSTAAGSQPADTGRKYANLRPSPYAIPSLVSSLREAYGELALFLYDVHGGDVIAVKWKPRAFLPQPFRPDAAGSRLLVVRGLAGREDSPASSKKSKGSQIGTDAAWLLPNVPEILEGIRALGGGLIPRQSLQTGGSDRIRMST